MVPPDRDPDVHRYALSCRWSGSTGGGYEVYDREHEVRTSPKTTVLRLSADPAFRGDSSLLNPEQLVVAAVASCQLLSFLAVASRARVDVQAYEDDAEGIMPEGEPPLRLTEVNLHPRIWVAPGPSEERILHLVEVAHRACYVSNSLRTNIRIESTVIISPVTG